MSRPISRRDLEALSAHLDGELTPNERAKLEARFRNEPELLSAYQAMERTRKVLRAAPRVKASRNFTLTAEMLGEGGKLAGRLYPTMRLAWALATALFVLVFLGDVGGTVLRRGALQAPMAADQAMEALPVEEPVAEGSGTPEAPEMQMAAPAEEMGEETLGTPLPELAGTATETTRAAGTSGFGGGGTQPTGTPSEKETDRISQTPTTGEIIPSAPPEAAEAESAEDMTMMSEAVTEEGGEAPLRMKAPRELEEEIPLIRYVEGGLILTVVVTGLAAWVMRRRG